MQRENIASLIHEQVHTHETQSLSFLLYFLSILYEFIRQEEVQDSGSLSELTKMLREDFIENQEFREFCIHSNKKETQDIYEEIVLLVSQFVAFEQKNDRSILLDIEDRIQKIYIMLVQVVESPHHINR